MGIETSSRRSAGEAQGEGTWPPGCFIWSDKSCMQSAWRQRKPKSFCRSGVDSPIFRAKLAEVEKCLDYCARAKKRKKRKRQKKSRLGGRRTGCERLRMRRAKFQLREKDKPRRPSVAVGRGGRKGREGAKVEIL